MAIVRWNPFQEMDALHSEMNRLFSRLNSVTSGETGYRENPGAGSPRQWMLPMDVVETVDALKLKAALPGVEPADVNIECNDDVLTVRAERRYEDKAEEGAYRWVEQQYGSFSRTLTLPHWADVDKIEATYHNGVLELTIPRRENAKPRRIELKSDTNAPRTLEAGTADASAHEDNKPEGKS